MHRYIGHIVTVLIATIVIILLWAVPSEFLDANREMRDGFTTIAGTVIVGTIMYAAVNPRQSDKVSPSL